MDTVGPALEALLGVATARLKACGKETSSAVLAPGNNVVWDTCCDEGGGKGGQLWVRLISQVPQPAGSQVCGITDIQVRGAVGVVRCMHCLDDEGNAPSTEHMKDDTLATTRDADILLQAIQGWQEIEWTLEGVRRKGSSLVVWKTLKVETGVPLGPTGCCGGFEWTFVVRIQSCPGC